MGLNVNTQNTKYKSEFGHVKLGNIFEKKKRRKGLGLVYNYTTPNVPDVIWFWKLSKVGPGWDLDGKTSFIKVGLELL